MDKHTRLNLILDMLLEKHSLRVEDIVEELSISPATARRDLDTLSSQQLLTRTRGGAVSNPTSTEVPLRYKTASHNKAKLHIAKAAADLIEPGQVIGLNGGTTTTEVAREIALKVGENEDFIENPVTIVTNAINIANELVVRPQIQVVVIGGIVRPKSYELVGPLSELFFPSISIDHLFLGVVAIDPERGVFNDDMAEAHINASLVKASTRVSVVADSTKLNTKSFVKICGFKSINNLITNGPIDKNMKKALEEVSINIIET